MLFSASALFLSLFLASASAVPSPMSEVKGTVEALRSIANDPALKSESRKNEKRARIRALILERMDLAEMAKRSLGRHWKEISGKERAEYLDLFAKYIEVFYRERVFNSVEFIGVVEMRYLKEIVDGEFAEVDTEARAGNDRVPVVYKLHLVAGHWKAYDVVIENVSIVSSLRAQFDHVITQESFAELLRRLREKIEELDK